MNKRKEENIIEELKKEKYKVEKLETLLELKEQELKRKEKYFKEFNDSLEEVCRNLTSELDQVKKESAQNARAKDMFLSKVTHELRTPLNGIIGISELLLINYEKSEKTVSHLKHINESGHTLLSIVNDVLDYSKLRSGRERKESVSFDVDEIFSELNPLFENQLEEKNIALYFSLKDITELKIATDKRKLKQILINLIGNALKFTEAKGEIKVIVRPYKIVSDTRYIEFVVQDNGKGISKDAQEVLFKPFMQEDNSVSRSHGGSGLGLAIVKNYVELLGGKIRVQSEIDKGAKFSFYILANNPEELPLEEVLESSFEVNKDFAKSYPLNILIAEDNHVNQIVIKETLSLLGYDIEIAENGKICLDKINAHEFDFIFMDIQMPVMDGFEATKKIRERFTMEELPIYALSANRGELFVRKCLNAGANGVTYKPLVIDELTNILSSAYKELKKCA